MPWIEAAAPTKGAISPQRVRAGGRAWPQAIQARIHSPALMSWGQRM